MRAAARNSKYHIRKLPHDKRVIILYGENENYMRFYKCWNCHFIIDSDNRAYGGRGDGITHTEFADNVADRIMTGDTRNITPTLDGLDFYHVVIKHKAGGDPDYDLVHHLKAEVGQGCPFCGTLNWR